jgi:hypothetical protein
LPGRVPGSFSYQSTSPPSSGRFQRGNTMAFVTSRNPLAGREIKVSVYGPDGKLQSITFVAQYRRFKRKAFQALQEQISKIGQPVFDESKQATGEFHKAPYETDLHMLKDVLGGWVGVQHADGTERACTQDEVESLVEDWPELLQPLINGFFEVHREAPREKN